MHIFLHAGHVSLSSPAWPGSCDPARCHSVFPHQQEAKLKRQPTSWELGFSSPCACSGDADDRSGSLNLSFISQSFPFWLAFTPPWAEPAKLRLRWPEERRPAPAGLIRRANIDLRRRHFAAVIAFHTAGLDAKHSACKRAAMLAAAVAALCSVGGNLQPLITVGSFLSLRCFLWMFTKELEGGEEERKSSLLRREASRFLS